MKFPEGIKAVFFDMDGTILNTEPIHAEAIHQILLKDNIFLSPHEIEKKFYGVSDADVYKAFKGRISTALEIFLKTKNELMKAHILSYPKAEFEKLLTPGFYSFIQKLKERNIKIALVSASEKEVIKAILEHLGIKNIFSAIVSREDTEETKPRPDPYLLAFKHLDVTKEEVLIFEDSPSGLKSALSTGSKVIQVRAFSPPLSDEVSFCIDNFSRIIF